MALIAILSLCDDAFEYIIFIVENEDRTLHAEHRAGTSGMSSNTLLVNAYKNQAEFYSYILEKHASNGMNVKGRLMVIPS